MHLSTNINVVLEGVADNCVIVFAYPTTILPLSITHSPYDICCFRVTIAYNSSKIDCMKQFLSTNHCLHGSARQVVIGDLAFKGEVQNLTPSQFGHR